jgi:antitoxin ParD1/3/4
MNVHLGETFDKFVAELISTGLYQSQSEVIREGLRLLKEREELREIRLTELRREIKKGMDSLERGEGTELNMEEIKAEGRKRRAARHGKGV